MDWLASPGAGLQDLCDPRQPGWQPKHIPLGLCCHGMGQRLLEAFPSLGQGLVLRELAGPSQAALQSCRLPARALPAEGRPLQTPAAWAAPAQRHMHHLSIEWLLRWDLQY